MVQIYVGDKVMVQGLMNQTHYNGRVGVVMQLISSRPESKCQIKLINVVRGGALEEKELILKTRCLQLVAAGHRYHAEHEPECTEESQCTTLVGYGESHEPRQSINPMVWSLAARKRET